MKRFFAVVLFAVLAVHEGAAQEQKSDSLRLGRIYKIGEVVVSNRNP